MKTEQQVRDKIKEHEDRLNEILSEFKKYPRMTINTLRSLRQGRKALLWVLSEDEYIEPDKLDNKISKIESSEIF